MCLEVIVNINNWIRSIRAAKIAYDLKNSGILISQSIFGPFVLNYYIAKLTIFCNVIFPLILYSSNDSYHGNLSTFNYLGIIMCIILTNKGASKQGKISCWGIENKFFFHPQSSMIFKLPTIVENSKSFENVNSERK